MSLYTRDPFFDSLPSRQVHDPVRSLLCPMACVARVRSPFTCPLRHNHDEFTDAPDLLSYHVSATQAG